MIICSAVEVIVKDSQIKENLSIRHKLFWRSRRGMLELDIILDAFIRLNFDRLDACEIAQYDQLLHLDDVDIMDLIMQRASSETGKGMEKIIEKICRFL